MKRIMNIVAKSSAALLMVAASSFSYAAEMNTVEVKMNEIDAAGKEVAVGTVTLKKTPWGVLFTPNLKNLPAGMHGFHLHEKPDCGKSTSPEGVVVAGGAAGGHWDPKKTGKHEGPYGEGHLGDLPTLYVAADGTATMPVLAPRIKNLRKVHALALMVHAGGDNHSDHPAKLGGGGARIACGVID